jgi:hypothetical protein
VVLPLQQEVESLAAQQGKKVNFATGNQVIPRNVATMRRLWAQMELLVEEGDVKVKVCQTL